MYTYKAKVLKVIDGDTIDVLIDLGFDIQHKIRLRLFGINTPETRTKDLKEKYLGLTSKWYLSHLLKNRDIIVKTYKTGKYGRYLATIYLKGSKKSINQKILEEGLAEIYFGGKRG